MPEVPRLVPLPGYPNLLFRFVPNTSIYTVKLSGFVEIFKQEENTNISLEDKEIGSLAELLRATTDLWQRTTRKKPFIATVRAFVSDYLSKLFPEARDEIPSDVDEAVEPILEDVQGIGPKTAAELRKKGITDIHQLRRTPKDFLMKEIKYIGEKKTKRVKEQAEDKVKEMKDENKPKGQFLKEMQKQYDRLTKSE